ncbi:MAG: hypothetical protein HY843_08210 [Bdellovibrio sp.]|nr:hypothetical protein [Bdellovibrio sp.]
MRLKITIIVCFLAVLATSCGYTFQRTSKATFGLQTVNRIYVKPMVNNSYKPGVENLVYNALLKKFSLQKNVELVSSQENADALLIGVVTQANYVAGGMTDVAGFLENTILPPEKRFQGLAVATSYTASLNCQFTLLEYKDKKEGKSLWGSQFSSSKGFPATNRLDVFGTTATHINESEFDRALGDLAEGIVRDLYESIYWRF